jgi:Rod binding domain-containing protein
MIRAANSPLSTVSPTPAVGTTSRAEENPALDRVCKDFEAVFLRQLLEVSKVGQQAGAGYGSMVVDALATSVNDAGGLGLAERIRQALESKR